MKGLVFRVRQKIDHFLKAPPYYVRDGTLRDSIIISVDS